jgi:hypothetical protein
MEMNKKYNQKTLTGLIRENHFDINDFHNLKFRKVKKIKYIFLKRKQEDKIQSYIYFKERDLNTNQIINEINKELQKLNTYDKKDILVNIYDEIHKITSQIQKI